MIPVSIRTNLDLHNEEWPRELTAVPAVGDHIASKTQHSDGFRLELQVKRITWRPTACSSYIPEIELHMTEHQQQLRIFSDPTIAPGSIRAFYEWYAPKVGKSVGAFI